MGGCTSSVGGFCSSEEAGKSLQEQKRDFGRVFGGYLENGLPHKGRSTLVGDIVAQCVYVFHLGGGGSEELSNKVESSNRIFGQI